MIVYAIVDQRLTPDRGSHEREFGFFEGEMFLERDLAEDFLEDIRRDDPDLAANLAIVERDYEELAKEVGTVDPVAGRALEVVKEVIDGVDIGASDPEARRALEFIKEALDEGYEDSDDAS